MLIEKHAPVRSKTDFFPMNQKCFNVAFGCSEYCKYQIPRAEEEVC